MRGRTLKAASGDARPTERRVYREGTAIMTETFSGSPLQEIV